MYYLQKLPKAGEPLLKTKALNNARGLIQVCLGMSTNTANNYLLSIMNTNILSE